MNKELILGNLQNNSRFNHTDYSSLSETSISTKEFDATLRQLESEGIIMKYRIRVSARSLGLNHFFGITPKADDSDLERLIKHPNTTWIAKTSEGALFFNFFSTKEIPHFKLSDTYIVYQESESMALPNFNVLGVPILQQYPPPIDQKYTITKEDLAVLDKLNENSRNPDNIDIQNFIEIEKRLQYHGVIRLMKTDLALKKLGFQNYRYLISSSDLEKTKTFIQKTSFVTYCSILTGPDYNLILNALFKNSESRGEFNRLLELNGVIQFNQYHLVMSHKRTNIPEIARRRI